jgi:hypothetical protein
MSEDEKNCGATLVSYRPFGSPEFVVKFTHSTKFPRLRQTSVDDKLQPEISVVAVRRIKRPPQMVPEWCSTWRSRARWSRRSISVGAGVGHNNLYNRLGSEGKGIESALAIDAAAKRRFRESLLSESDGFCCPRVPKRIFFILSSLCARRAPSFYDPVGNIFYRCDTRSSPWSFVKDPDDSTGT